MITARRSQETSLRPVAAFIVGLFALTGVAQAQSAAPGKGYVEAVAQSAIGNVTSQAFGAEAGVTVAPRLQVFGEVGKVRDTSPPTLGTSAQLIAGFLSQTQTGVAFSVKQPVTFGLGGVRYVVPSGRVEPYVLGGAGIARVRRDVTFTAGGSDVTSTLPQMGVVLGTDLSGAETKLMITLGGGVVWPAWRQLIVDFQFRYGRILTEGQGTNVTRAGIGLGVRF
jgi:opacity protein-like surface antigen